MNMHRRQFDNRLLADMGVRPRWWQVAEVGPGDRIRVIRCLYEAAPATLDAEVESVLDHGYYVVLVVRCDGERQFWTLPRDYPPRWGVISCEITDRRHKPLHPHHWRP